MFNRLRALFAFALIALLAACETTPNPTRLENKEALPSTFGVVTVQVVSNSLRLTWALRSWNAVYVVNVDDPTDTQVLTPSGTGFMRSRVFVGALPPGEYALFGMASVRRVGDATHSLQIPLSRSLGTFVVEQNRISSLGTLVFQPTGTLEGFTRGDEQPYIVTRFDDFDDFSSFVFDVYPEMRGQLNEDTMLGWEFDPHQPYRDELVDFIKSVPVGLSHHWLGEGRIAMLGVLGQIIVRDPETRVWTQYDTGFNQQLADLVHVDSLFLASGERGLLIAAPAIEGPWHRIQGPSSQEPLIWIHYEPDFGLYGLTRVGTDVKLYSAAPDFSSWSVVETFDLLSGFLEPIVDDIHAFAPGDGTLVLMTGGDRISYDLATGERRSSRVSTPFLLARQPDGTLISSMFMLGGAGGRPKYSFDDGQSWSEIFRHRDDEHWAYNTMPLVVDESATLFVSQRLYRDQERRIRTESVPRTRVFLHDRVGVASWGEKMEPGCTWLMPEISTSNLIFSSCIDGRLFRSDDRGQTWELDYQPGMDQESADDLKRREPSV